MSKVVLTGETTTGLQRTTVHTKYEGRAFGMYVLGRHIPFSFNVRVPGRRSVKAIIVFGKSAHIKPMHSDYGVVEKKYQRVYTFNIRHYLQCYLPNVMGSDGQLTTPFTYNECEFCQASIHDADQLLAEMIHRTYRPDKYIWQAKDTLQDAAGDEPVFSHHEGVK